MLPTGLVMPQESDELPECPVEKGTLAGDPAASKPMLDTTVPP
jgi:hypothetical protein